MSSPSDVNELAMPLPALDEPQDSLALDTGKQSRIISKVLTPAMRFWLRSQLDQVEDLQLVIEAGDRQLLSGALRQASLAAQKAIYQGLHVSQVQVSAAGIRTNLGQVLGGKPFRLLEPFLVRGNLVMQEADLNASLQSPLLAQAVIDFLLPFLTANAAMIPSSLDRQLLRFENSTVRIEPDHVTLTADLVHPANITLPIAFRTGIAIEQGNRLHLRQPHWLHEDSAQLPGDQVFALGEHVYLDTLILEVGQIRCRGQVTVIPE